MGELRCTLKQVQDGVSVPLDETTTIIVVPAVAQVTLKGRAFEAGRTFLLPRGINALNEVWAFATRMQAKHAVVVAHVEAVDAEADALSKARATIAQSWLAGDTAPWLKQFESSIAEAQRWGSREDKHLLSVALGGAAVPSPGPGETGDPRLRAFQALAGVKVDGIAGPVTRGKLVEKYFAVSRAALLNAAKPPANGITLLETKVAALGAGANFTLQQVKDAKKAAEEESASTPQATGDTNSQSKTEASDSTEINPATPPEPEARVDFMFFFSEKGPEPAPGLPDGPEFLEWVKQTELQRVATVGSPAGANTLLVELWDKARLTRHKGAKYTLAGPESFSGTTDSQGRIEHDDVLPGDYALTLTLEFFEGADKITDEYKASLIVQNGSAAPQVRALGAVPRCELAQLKGLLFDTSKAFLVPEAVTALKEIRQIYERHNGGELLVVGHTDTMGNPSFNDPLSFERAKATLAYLQDDVDTWLSFYETGIPEARRWGEAEDARMQELVNDPSLTRRDLIAAYMDLDGATLEASEFTIHGTAHGCGESFPLDDTGKELDTAPSNEKEDPLDRRVELFFFDPEFGIVPKPAGEISKPGSTQYLEWRKSAKVVSEGVVTIPLPPPSPAETLPAGCFGFDLSFPTPGIMPALKRFAERAKAAERTIGIFAHTDKVGSEAYNKSLSDRRGKATFAVMTGNLELFESVASEESWGDDVYQSMLRGLGCNPGPMDGKIGPLSERAVADFQRDYNANLFHTKERQRTASDLEVNGKLDDLTRTALRDAYVAHFSTGLSDADFQGPKFSGCGEFVPISDDADHNRRVTLTVYPERPSPGVFPCVQGDASACDLDDQKPRRCRFYRKVVLEDEQLPPPTLADFEWLKLGDGRIHLSAVTSAPDDQEARFTVHKTTTEPANPLPNSELQPGPRMELGNQVGGSVTGVAALGVIECKWSAPDGFDPFDVDQWLVNLGMPSTGDDDEPDEEPDATPEAAGSDDYFHPPLFCVEFENAWAYSPPPGERLARFLLRNDAGGPVSGLALHSDGFAEAFDTDGTRIAKGRDELVIRLALNPDSDIDEEQA